MKALCLLRSKQNINQYQVRNLRSRLGIQCVAAVVRHGRFRWFGNLECRKEDDWVPSCRDMEVDSLNLRAGARRFGGG